MMIREIDKLVNEYTRWLRDKTILKEIGTAWVEITTPYLDRHNDCLQIYACREGNGFILTDDGYIIDDLINSGCPLDTPKRRKLLKTTLAGFGVQMEGDQLTVHTTPENFSLKKHNIIQAMLSVNDLFFLASPYVAGLFLEDVTDWLEFSDIRYASNIKFTGKSGCDYMFNFLIPKSRTQPERIVQAVANPQKNSADALVVKWLDTREMRSPDAMLFAFLNDSNTNVPLSTIGTLKNWDIKPVPWSQREESRELLAA